MLFLVDISSHCSVSYLKCLMIKIIRREKKNPENSEFFPLYTHREIVYTCLNKLGIETARTTCRNIITLHRGLFNRTKCTKEKESILLMLVLLHHFLYSYNFLFQIQSSSLLKAETYVTEISNFS
jgi:hypothetical protein